MVNQLLVNSIIAGSIYALVALSFTIIYRTVKFFHLAHGIVCTIGAYFAYTFIILLRLNPIISFLFASMLASVVGVGIDRLVYFPLRQQKSSKLVFLITSFGIFIFLQNIIHLIYGAQILTLRTSPIKEGYHFCGAVITPIQIWIILISCVLMVILWFFIKNTKIGKAMRAVSDDPVASNVVGINPEQIIFISFAVGSAIGGVGGILISLEIDIEPTMGFSIIFKAIIGSIIGGIGSIPGAVIGSFFLGLAENFGIWKIPAGWKDCIAFVILIIFLLIRPKGFLGTKTIKEII